MNILRGEQVITGLRIEDLFDEAEEEEDIHSAPTTPRATTPRENNNNNAQPPLANNAPYFSSVAQIPFLKVEEDPQKRRVGTAPIPVRPRNLLPPQSKPPVPLKPDFAKKSP